MGYEMLETKSILRMLMVLMVGALWAPPALAGEYDCQDRLSNAYLMCASNFKRFITQEKISDNEIQNADAHLADLEVSVEEPGAKEKKYRDAYDINQCFLSLMAKQKTAGKDKHCVLSLSQSSFKHSFNDYLFQCVSNNWQATKNLNCIAEPRCRETNSLFSDGWLKDEGDNFTPFANGWSFFAWINSGGKIRQEATEELLIYRNLTVQSERSPDTGHMEIWYDTSPLGEIVISFDESLLNIGHTINQYIGKKRLERQNLLERVEQQIASYKLKQKKHEKNLKKCYQTPWASREICEPKFQKILDQVEEFDRNFEAEGNGISDPRAKGSILIREATRTNLKNILINDTEIHLDQNDVEKTRPNAHSLWDSQRIRTQPPDLIKTYIYYNSISRVTPQKVRIRISGNTKAAIDAAIFSRAQNQNQINLSFSDRSDIVFQLAPLRISEKINKFKRVVKTGCLVPFDRVLNRK